MNVLESGAAGKVGQFVCRELAPHHSLRVLEIRLAAGGLRLATCGWRGKLVREG